MSNNDPMSQERLDAIRGRVEASTWTKAEPWDYAEDDWDGWCVSICDSGFGTAYVAKDIQQGEDEGRSDAALIAHAPQDLAALLAEVERLRALTAVDKAMVERTAKALFIDRARSNTEDKWARLPEGVRDSWRMDVRAVLNAALTDQEH